MSQIEPFFSIIVPCYNQEKYISECLYSVLNQTFTNWECIIINDGSTDNSENIILEFLSKDSRFFYKSKSNSGLASTRNFGINLAKGSYILPLDGDDKIGKNYLSKANKILIKNPSVKLIYCNAKLFGFENKKYKLEEYNYRRLLFNNSIFCSAIFKKSDFLNTDGYDKNMIFGYEDWEFWLQLLNKNDAVIKIQSVEFYYRKRGDSMIDFIKNKENLNQMRSYIFNKHYSKYAEILKLENNIDGYRDIIYGQDKLSKIENSLSYKVFYKVEQEIKRFINRFR